MQKTARLSKDDWLRAGFAALVENGPNALKAEPMSRRLGTTKGSFYWHFADVPDFHKSLLDHWEKRGYSDVVAGLESEPSLPARLRKLALIASNAASLDFGGFSPEPAIRAWARSDPHAAAVVREVDAKRLAYLETLFAQIGLTNPDFARLSYAALIGLEDIASRDQGDIERPLGTLMDIFLTLE